MATAPLSLDGLRAEVAGGEVDTVRVCFSDHYGMLRGRRLVGEVFAQDPEAVQAFCDGALVWDVHCDIFEETDYSNFRTGYPDLFAHPDLASLRRCGWSQGSAMVLTHVTDPHGKPSPLDPRGLLARAAERLDAGPVALTLSIRAGYGRLGPGWEPGPAPEFADLWRAGLEGSSVAFDSLDYDPKGCRAVLRLSPAAPVAAADALVTARSAAREIGLVEGITVTTMGRLAPGAPDEPMAISPGGGFPADAGSLSRLADLALLCRSLPLGWPAGSLDDSAAVVASASASPYLATAATLIAAGAAAEGGGESPPASLAEAAGRLEEAAWAADWLGPMFIHDAIELARREAAMRKEAAGSNPEATAWDIARYGEVG